MKCSGCCSIHLHVHLLPRFLIHAMVLAGPGSVKVDRCVDTGLMYEIDQCMLYTTVNVDIQLQRERERTTQRRGEIPSCIC